MTAEAVRGTRRLAKPHDGREHVHVLGRYHFTLDESVAGGGMRPLRDPSEFDEYQFPLLGFGELPL